MKSISTILIPIIVGLCSVFLFRDRIDDLTATLKKYYNDNYISTTATHEPVNALPRTTTATDQQPEEQEPHLYATEMSVPRTIRKVFEAIEQAEGAGARVRRSIGTPALRQFSPFLMLDHFSIKPGAGFPDQYVCASPLVLNKSIPC